MGPVFIYICTMALRARWALRYGGVDRRSGLIAIHAIGHQRLFHCGTPVSDIVDASSEASQSTSCTL